MDKLSGLQVFKYLPAAKKLPEGNCKKCKFPTCMAYALKLANGQADVELCPYLPEELKSKLSQSLKKPQKEVYLGHKNKVLTGGENVLYRHDKTFVNKTIIAVTLDFEADDWHEKLNRILDFAITRINTTYKIDLVCLKGEIPPEALEKLDLAGIAWVTEQDLSVLDMVKDEGVIKTVENLTDIRKKAILEKDEKFSNPVAIYFKKTEDLLELNSKAAFYLCKYANVLIFENFDEALFSTLMILRQDIYTDPQKPLQVESKVYEFNNPDENSLIFLSTNFALTFFAVSSELEALKRSSYLIVTPSEGMSILTAWAAEKITAQMIAKTVENLGLEQKVKTKRIIIPGLLSHMKDEIQEALPQFDIVVGTIEAYKISDFVKTLCD